jgi:choline kinase/8-oxo-dGTP pyrophosphatase MutT (NUDIX family)
MTGQAILLGAGRGSRLAAERGARPKWMLEVEGQSLAQHLTNVLHAHDVAEILLVRGALGGTVLSPSMDYADVIGSPNMLHTLHEVRDRVRSDVIVGYCDLLLEPRVVRALLAHTGEAGVVVDLWWRNLFSLRHDNPLAIAESCRLSSHRIAEIGQPLGPGELPEAQYVGITRFSAGMFAELMRLYEILDRETDGRPWRNAPSFKAAYFTDFLQEAIDRGFPIDAVCIEGGWLEFDTPRDLALARQLARDPRPSIFDFARLPEHPSVLSAGGVAVRGAQPTREVLLVGSGAMGEWRIPKGMLDRGESVEDAACREVREETGIAVRIDTLVDRAEWTYEYGGRKWRERCFFHRMAATSDSPPGADVEHSVAAWISEAAALAGMRFEEERRALELALR